MPRRDDRLRIGDILQAIQRIEQYTEGMTFEAFVGDQKTVDAVVRSFPNESARKSKSMSIRDGVSMVAIS